MSEKLLLKDQLFNPVKVAYLAQSIKEVYPAFKSKDFEKAVVSKFPELELKERLIWITKQFKFLLPDDFRTTTSILLKSLPPPCDPTLSDNDFGDFIFAPHGEYVATYGCNKEDLQFSLNALKEMTQRFSVEGPIRPFLNAFPEETLKELNQWVTNEHYHVRRLCSEGTRPKLPWAPKIGIDIEESIPILNQLYFDKTRFVTRSVANHLNDISKIAPDLVLKTLKRWKNSKKQSSVEMDYIIRHSLRTLIKAGHTDTMIFLGYSSEPDVKVNHFSLEHAIVNIGESLHFHFELEALKDEELIVDYRIHFQNKKGQRVPKTFKMKTCNLKKGERAFLSKKHPLKLMTTKKLYSGKHALELQINGQSFGQLQFQLNV